MSSPDPTLNIDNCYKRLQDYNSFVLAWLNICIEQKLINLKNTQRIPLSPNIMLNSKGATLRDTFNEKLPNQPNPSGGDNCAKSGAQPLSQFAQQLRNKYPNSMICSLVTFNNSGSTWIRREPEFIVGLFKNGVAQTMVTEIARFLGTCEDMKNNIFCQGPPNIKSNAKINRICNAPDASPPPPPKFDGPTSQSILQAAHDSAKVGNPRMDSIPEGPKGSEEDPPSMFGGKKSRKRRKGKKAKKTRKARKPKKTRKARKVKKAKKSRK